MTKVEYSSSSGPSYTDLLPQASAGEDSRVRINMENMQPTHKHLKTLNHLLTLHLDQFGHVCAE